MTIRRLEHGVVRPRFQTLARLAQGLNLTREQLLHEDPNGSMSRRFAHRPVPHPATETAR